MKGLGLALLLPLLITTQDQFPPAVIDGIVTDFLTSAPVRDVELILGGTGRTTQRVTTDASGRFAFRNIEAGRYFIKATHPDYLNQAFGMPVESLYRADTRDFSISAGQRFEASIQMLRGASISGRIYDINRAPVADARVFLRVLQIQRAGPPILTGVADGGVDPINVRTNAEGDYRITGVPPGEYFVGAAPEVPSSTRSSANDAATTYYPGQQSPDRAVPIKVAAGADIRSIDFVIEPESPLRISGQIVNSLVAGQEGTDYSYEFTLVRRNARIMQTFFTLPDYADAPDMFELRGISPGTYDLFIAYSPRSKSPRDRVASFVGRSVVDISDRNLEGMKITIEAALDIAGRINLDASAQAILKDWRNLTLYLQPADGLPRHYQPVLDPRTINPDGTFVLTGVLPGRYLLVLLPDPRMNLFPSVARLGVRDILTQSFDVERGTKGTFVFELTGEAGGFEGTVRDRNSAPVPQAQVILIPTDQAEELPQYKLSASDAEGRFSVVGLRPGTYAAYAFAKIEPFKWNDRQYMLQFSASASPVVVQRKSRVQQDLRVIP